MKLIENKGKNGKEMEEEDILRRKTHTDGERRRQKSLRKPLLSNKSTLFFTLKMQHLALNKKGLAISELVSYNEQKALA